MSGGHSADEEWIPLNDDVATALVDKGSGEPDRLAEGASAGNSGKAWNRAATLLWASPF